MKLTLKKASEIMGCRNGNLKLRYLLGGRLPGNGQGTMNAEKKKSMPARRPRTGTKAPCRTGWPRLRRGRSAPDGRRPIVILYPEGTLMALLYVDNPDGKLQQAYQDAEYAWGHSGPSDYDASVISYLEGLGYRNIAIDDDVEAIFSGL